MCSSSTRVYVFLFVDESRHEWWKHLKIKSNDNNRIKLFFYKYPSAKLIFVVFFCRKFKSRLKKLSWFLFSYVVSWWFCFFIQILTQILNLCEISIEKKAPICTKNEVSNSKENSYTFFYSTSRYDGLRNCHLCVRSHILNENNEKFGTYNETSRRLRSDIYRAQLIILLLMFRRCENKNKCRELHVMKWNLLK